MGRVLCVGYMLVGLFVPRTITGPGVRLGGNDEEGDVELNDILNEIEMLHFVPSKRWESGEAESAVSKLFATFMPPPLCDILFQTGFKSCEMN